MNWPPKKCPACGRRTLTIGKIEETKSICRNRNEVVEEFKPSIFMEVEKNADISSPKD